MNIYNISDEEFVTSKIYQDFILENRGRGTLKIRAFAANQAIPISNLKIVVSTNIKNNKIIFFEGYTDESGVIERIILPAPVTDVNNLTIPKKTIYEIEATYLPDNINDTYEIGMYANICVVQNINVVPSIEAGGI